MSGKPKVTGRLAAAARVLAGVGHDDFAKAAGISVEKCVAIEAGGSAWLESETDAAAILRAFDYFGVLVVEESDGMGAGVRLRFTRLDVKQLGRLEGEGGPARADDAP